MATKNQENWHLHFEELKKHVAVTGHFPDKHSTLCNWVKYQRKRIKGGHMPPDQLELFLALAASRSTEHTGGRTKEKK